MKYRFLTKKTKQKSYDKQKFETSFKKIVLMYKNLIHSDSSKFNICYDSQILIPPHQKNKALVIKNYGILFLKYFKKSEDERKDLVEYIVGVIDANIIHLDKFEV